VTHPKAPGTAVDITEPMIRKLVETFYAKIREDGELGPIFNSAVEDWDAHYDKLCAFWSSVVLMSGRYKGRPMPAHAALPGISDEHFVRWLVLFGETASVACPAEAAHLFIDRAKRIAESLKIGIALHRYHSAGGLNDTTHATQA
jgi:hemoglobin